MSSFSLFNISYSTNFKPSFNNTILEKQPYFFKKLRGKNHVLCRNFFLFFLYLKYCYNKNYFSSISLFIKPRYFQTYTVLRAPYRYKLGRYQFTTSRYYVLCSFKLNIQNKLAFFSTTQIASFIKLCKNFYPWFESNLCYQHRVFLSFSARINSLFFFKNYK